MIRQVHHQTRPSPVQYRPQSLPAHGSDVVPHDIHSLSPQRIVTQAFSSSSKQNFNFYLEGNDEASGFFIYLYLPFFFFCVCPCSGQSSRVGYIFPTIPCLNISKGNVHVCLNKSFELKIFTYPAFFRFIRSDFCRCARTICHRTNETLLWATQKEAGHGRYLIILQAFQ